MNRIHNPLAVYLYKEKGVLNVGVRQVIPEKFNHVGDYMKSKNLGAKGRLVHHVIFFSYMNHSEAQIHIRNYIAHKSSSRLPKKRGKVIIGEEEDIIKAMVGMSLDSTDFHEYASPEEEEEEEQDSSTNDCESDTESANSLNDFIVNTSEEEEEKAITEEEEEEEEEESCLRSGKRSRCDIEHMNTKKC
jgi:hypothetical protein